MVSVYKFTNLINGKIYVGSSININERVTRHRYDSTKSTINSIFYVAIRKYGWESFMFDVIEECCPLLRNDRENHWINYYHTLGKGGYNSQLADFSVKLPEVIIKMTKTSKGRKLSAEARENIRQGKLKQYKENGCKLTGRKHSEERKKKVSEAKKGSKNPNFGKYGELNPNFGNRGEKNPLYGKKHTEEHNKRSSEAKLGDKNPNFGKYGPLHPQYGRKHNEESKRRMSDGQKARNYKPTEESKRKSLETKRKNRAIKEAQRLLTGEPKPKGRKLTEEQIKTLREGHAAYWKRKREEKLLGGNKK